MKHLYKFILLFLVVIVFFVLNLLLGTVRIPALSVCRIL
jgi:hypothetical protein